MRERGRPAPEETRALLEEQFSYPEKLDVGGINIDVFDLQPRECKTDIPTIVVPGWSATASVFRENIISLAEQGRRVVVASAPHGVKAEPQSLYPQVEVRKAEAIVQALDHKGIDRVDAVSHSEAGIFLAVAATENMERFRNIVLVSPAGMIGPDTLPRLAKDFNADIANQTVKGLFHDQPRLVKIGTAYWEALKAWAENPKSTWEAIQAMVEYQIPDLLTRLKKEGHGITIIHGAHDQAFPMARMQVQTTTDMVDGFYSVKGSHNELYLKPHPLTELVDQALDALEKKYSSR